MSENPWEKKPSHSGDGQAENPWNQPSDNPWAQNRPGAEQPSASQPNAGQPTPTSPNAPRNSGKESTDPDLRSSNPEEDWAGLANSPQPPNYQRGAASAGGAAGAAGYGQGFQQGPYQQSPYQQGFQQGPPNGQGYQQGPYQQGGYQQGGYQQTYAPGPPQQGSYQQAPEKKSGKGWLIALIVLLILALIGGGLWWFLAGSKDGGSSEEPVTVYETEYEDETSSEETTAKEDDEDEDEDTETSEPEDSNGPKAVSSPSDYPSGLRSDGWTVSRNAQCNSTDEWVYAATNGSTYVSICENPDNGRYYYRGYSDGMGYEEDVDMASADVARGKFRVPAAPNTIVIDGKTLRVIAADGGELDSQRLPRAVYKSNY
ncbi:hypothetical protein [Corynebacterium urealyticum]|uniref:Uncharacterized protein n=1 Tax=Corynebacterium urealyticum (strain ATCC 43042 / DSM 7109) TaxID=504474 RepID=B1VHW2_CORU7|nr:hypothetical protein [Corynebacterium urealyticum]QQC42664.1 hypothetical protein I6H51_03630 [Corynebacterium urealyticum]CAQ05762.1 hypothetical protein cu1803 [Corynebacterium urealyticum DSM 7109]SNV91153.1 Uncharacterized protein conserved in bacteria [Corynebacterium urealyticum]